MINPYKELGRLSHIKLKVCVLPSEIKGLYVRCGDKIRLLLNKDSTQAERRSVLTEELMHYELGHTGDCLGEPTDYAEEIRRSKQEREARLRAADELIPDEALARYFDMDLHPSEVAEELWVSEELVRIKVERLRSRP